MATLSSLTINDRETTPVAHVFAPVDRPKPSTVRLRRQAVVPDGDEYLTMSVERMRDGSFKGTLKLEYPTLVTETINGVSRYRKERQSMASLELRFASTSTEQERKNLIGMLYNSLAASGASVVVDAFAKVEGWT